MELPEVCATISIYNKARGPWSPAGPSGSPTLRPLRRGARGRGGCGCSTVGQRQMQEKAL